MSGIRTLVTFESPAFNTTERRDYFINDCCYGDDVARWLIEQLRARGIHTDDEPGQEDFGWYFGFRAGDTDYHFVLAHRPADGSDPAVWVGGVERKAGLLGSMFGARKRGIQPESVRAIHSVLSSSPQVRNIRWHHQHHFDAGKEESGQAEPTSAQARMILALDKHAALYVFSSAKDAERELEAIDVQQDEFEFCDSAGQRYAVVYTIPPKVSRLGPLRSFDIGAFSLAAQGDIDSNLPEGFLERAAHIEHTSIPTFTSIEALRDELRKRA